MLGEMAPADRQAFTGNGQLGGKLGSVSVPASAEERAYLSSPMDGGQFLAYVFKTYPELRKVGFHPDRDIRSDPDSYATYRQAFYTGLYFAEQIHLADGSTLYDFLTKCGAKVDPLDGADVNPLAKPKPGFNMQFFPVLHEADGTTTDLQILFERQGDRITARSPLFSTSILTSPNFMEDHGIRCAR